MSVSVLEQKSILIAEESFRYQTPDGPVLSGVLSRASESHEIVVICHGLMGNKNTSDRVKLAYELAA